MSQVTVVVTRKEGDPLTFRISEDKIDLRVGDGWLIINERSGVFETHHTLQGPMKVEKAWTHAVVPGWNVLDCKVEKGGSGRGFTTA